MIERKTICILLTALLAAGCTKRQAPMEWHQENGYRWRDLAVGDGEPGFERVGAGESGIDFQNDVTDSLLLGNRILAQGAGVAIGDVDGDGRPDIFLGRTQGCSALYRNLGGWKFEDITKSAGVGVCDRNTTAAVFADVDGDGDLDLILLATRGPNAIFVNDGKGHFAEHRDLGLDAAGQGGATLALADVDGDGTLDMYVANYKPYTMDDSIPPQQRALNQVVRQTSKDKFDVVPEFQNEYRVVNRADMGGLRLSVRGAPDEFYRNVKGHFVRTTLQQIFRDTSGAPVGADPESFTLNARFVDLNGDGWPDLYVTNDFEDPDQLWFNDGHGLFRQVPWNAQRQTSNSSMGMDVADVNGDGRPDIFVDDMLGADTKRQKTEIPTHTAIPKRSGDFTTQLQQQRNVLYVNRGDGTFAEVGQLAGIQASGWSWSSLFVDVDLDGRQDLLIANGHLWDIMDADTQEGLQNRLNSFPWRRFRWQFPAYAIRNVAYRNRGDLTFEDVSARWHFGVENDVSHTMASGDLDGDGDLDVVVNRLRAPALLLRNTSGAGRLAVRALGDAPNTQAVGAKIRVLGGAVPLQEREVTAGGIYMSHSDYQATFAMGTHDTATLVIDWRDGRQTTIRGVHANRLYEVTQGTSTARAPSSAAQAPAPLFENVTSALGLQTHLQPPFDDWGRQFLLPDALSPLGPGLAWFDLDGDGNEDLIVGSAKGSRLQVFHNRNGKLSAASNEGASAPLDYTSVLGLSEGGRIRLFAGVSTWQVREESVMTAQPAVVSMAVNGGAVLSKAEALIGSHASATGPVALADIDGDGDVDMFVGSRVVPLQYPVPPSSAIFRNEHGKFVLDAANTALLHDVGMVSSAVFADLNGDGFDDLLIAREWGSILLLLNDGRGNFHVAPDSWGLARWTSRWNGVAVGDFNGDGRLDIVVTSWGRNTSMQADSVHPLALHYAPFGPKGEIEMLLARYDERLKADAPLSSYARVRVAFPDLVARVGTFAAYADASVAKVLGSYAGSAKRLDAITLDNMIFLNRGDHFDPKALPLEAQFAPAFYAGVADLDGDGAEDLFLGQNFSATPVGEPRYDGGRGLVLKGDGRGNLSPLSGALSGVIVYGDQRGAGLSDYDRDGRVDLAVTQNGAATQLFHNIGGAQGIRIRLQGNANNSSGIGAQMRLLYGGDAGPMREVSAGSGFWSQNGAVQVLGVRSGIRPTAVWVRWAGGRVVTVQIPANEREIIVRETTRGP